MDHPVCHNSAKKESRIYKYRMGQCELSVSPIQLKQKKKTTTKKKRPKTSNCCLMNDKFLKMFFFFFFSKSTTCRGGWARLSRTLWGSLWPVTASGLPTSSPITGVGPPAHRLHLLADTLQTATHMGTGRWCPDGGRSTAITIQATANVSQTKGNVLILHLKLKSNKAL